MPSPLVCEGRTDTSRGYPALLTDVWGGGTAGGCGRGTADFSTGRVRVRLADLGSRNRPSPGQWGSVGSVSWCGEGFSPVREENPPQTGRKPSTRTERGAPRGRYLRAHTLAAPRTRGQPSPPVRPGSGESGLPIQVGNAPQTNPRRPTAADRRQSAPPPHRMRRDGRSDRSTTQRAPKPPTHPAEEPDIRSNAVEGQAASWSRTEPRYTLRSPVSSDGVPRLPVSGPHAGRRCSGPEPRTPRGHFRWTTSCHRSHRVPLRFVAGQPPTVRTLVWPLTQCR